MLILLFVLAACSSKEKVTTSKIKISGASAFSAGGTLAQRANNGLILYGKSSDGKTFSKKVDIDTVDLEFPNGSWNFYAVAWEISGGAAADTGLRGDVSCAKALNVQLNGTDVQVNLNLSNTSCDADFHPNATSVSGNSGKQMFTNLSLYSCKNISGVSAYSSTTDCDYDLTNLKDNKGYATFIKLIVPEYKKFGSTLEQSATPAFTSKCFQVDHNIIAGTTTTGESSTLNSINLPMPGVNGFQVVAQIFYSKDGCLESNGFTTIGLNSSTKQKMFIANPTSIQPTVRFFLETDAAPICQGPRLDPNFFASGRGTASLPYTICNKEQLEKINTLYMDGTINARGSSFELLADIDFKMASITPIGDGANMFLGNFEGRNHRLDNYIIDCKVLSPSSNASSFGLFKMASTGRFSNLTINKFAMNCDKNSNGYTYNSIGSLVGSADALKLENIKVFGHSSGNQNVGGIIGTSSGNTTFSDVHFEGDVGGANYVGGIAGTIAGVGGVANMVSNSSVAAEVRAECSSSPCDSFVGGMFGDANFGAGVDFNRLVVKNKRLKGSKIIGGLIGRTLNVSIYDSIVTGLMMSNDYTDGATHFVTAGGLVGAVENGTFNRNIVVIHKKLNRNNSDVSEGALFGGVNNSNFPVCPSASAKPGRNFATFSNYYTGTACNADAAASLIQITDPTFYTSDSLATSFASEYPNHNWIGDDQGAGKDIPKLAWELTKESTVKYLKRECSGLYTTPAGNGSAASPYSVCSVSQFNNMSAGNYYTLKKNIFFSGSSVTMKPAGIYKLNGNGYSLIDINLSLSAGDNGSFGVFKELENGSEIKNLNIISSSLSAPTGFAVSGSMLRVGLLAGRNNGIIENVNVDSSSLGFERLDTTTVSSYSIFLGSLVGFNDSNGKIQFSEAGIYTKLYQPKIDDDYVFAGGVAGKNYGLIHAFKSHSSLIRAAGGSIASDFSYVGPLEAQSCSFASISSGYYAKNTNDGKVYACNTSTLNEVTLMGGNEYWGSFAGINNGSITESEIEGELTIVDMNNNTNGTVAPIVGLNNSGATIGDIHYRGKFDNSKSVQNLAVSTNSGSITRTIFQPKSLVGFSAGSDVFGGNITEGVCIIPSGNSGCHDSGTLSISYTDPTLTISSSSPLGPVNYSNSWNVYTGFLPDSTKVWQFESGELHLMKIGGNFDKLGKGF